MMLPEPFRPPEASTVELPKENPLSKETMGVIWQRYTDSTTYVRPWHELIRTWRRLYNFDHYNEKAKSMETQYADPTPTNTVDLAVGILLANELNFRAYGWKSNDAEEHATSRVEKYLAGTLQIGSDRTQVYIPYEIVRDFCRDGAGVIFSVWDPQLHEEFLDEFELPDPEVQAGTKVVPGFKETPIRTERVDPLQMSMIPGGRKRWLHVFRTFEMTVFDVEKLYGLTLKRYKGYPDEMKMQTKGKVVDYWRYATLEQTLGFNRVLGKPETTKHDVVVNALIFEQEFIMDPRIMEGYEDIPYTFGFFKPVDPNEPGMWGHSIIQPMQTTVALLEQAVNRRLRQLTIYSSLPLVIKSEMGRKLDIDPGFGNIIQIAPQEDVGFPLWPGNPPDFREHMDFLRSRLQQAGFSDVMFGSGTSQVSGYALSQLGDQNRIRLEQPRRHLEMFWSTWGKKVLNMTTQFATNSLVRVYGRMRGKDFADQVIGQDLSEYMVKCLIKPQFPNEQVRKHAMATQAKGSLSTRTIMENYYDIEQADDEMDRIMEEQAERHPIMQQYAMLTLLTERAAGGDKAAAMVVQQMQAQMNGGIPGAGAGGRPPGPLGAAPGNALGMPSAGGGMTPQEQGGPPPGQSEEDQLGQMSGLAPSMTSGMIGGAMPE